MNSSIHVKNVILKRTRAMLLRVSAYRIPILFIKKQKPNARSSQTYHLLAWMRYTMRKSNNTPNVRTDLPFFRALNWEHPFYFISLSSLIRLSIFIPPICHRKNADASASVRALTSQRSEKVNQTRNRKCVGAIQEWSAKLNSELIDSMISLCQSQHFS